MVRAAAARMSAPAEQAVGGRIGGRYRIEERIGRGGMGTVYRVVDESSGRSLALKQLGGREVDLVGSERAHLRFRREFHTVAGLRHPRIVAVHDFGVDHRGPYYTMELLDGTDVGDIGPAEPELACRILRDVASALAFIHDRRLLHRDLAPRNIRCTSDGRAKLIDFGILATVGVTGEVSGTPPFIAPENLRGLPLDHLADLFGLGALAYWLLTGSNAFPAKAFEELETRWMHRPDPPSAFRHNVPPALDALVMSLLSIDPLGRPASAAEVLSRLSGIVELEPLPPAEAARGYLASAALIGRKYEMAQLKRYLQSTTSGKGRAILIEAPSGTGKSRLLHELGLEAQLSACVVLRAGSQAAGRGPYGVVRGLARELLSTAPREAAAAAVPHAPVLARIVPELSQHVGPVVLAELGDPAEDRYRAQAALIALFTDVAQQRPIVLLIDDVQRCDEASAAVIASLAHASSDYRLMVGAVLRTDEEVRAAPAIAALRDASARIRLRGLRERDVDELVRALFGNVPNATRLASWMHRIAGGSPLHCTELARHMVDRGLVRFADGAWVIPDQLEQGDLPAGLADAMDARIASLRPSARAVAEALSIYGGAFSLESVALVAEERDQQELFSALDQLLFEEVLIGSGDQYQFRHDGLREALLRRIDDDRRRRLHRWVGEALVAAGPIDPVNEAEVGWHLLRGGDELRGANLLESAGRQLYGAQSFADAISPLEAALEVYQVSRASARVRMDLRHMLLMSGTMADRDTALRHIEPTVDGFARYSGISVARRLKPALGRHLALAIGLVWATVRWLLSVPRRRGPNPLDALSTFFVAVGYAASVYSLSFDLAGVRRMLAHVDPIAIFKNRVPYAVYLITRAMLSLPEGRSVETRWCARRILEILARDRLTPIRELDRKTGEGGARYLLVLLAVMDQEPNFQEELLALERMDLRFFDVGAQQLRVAYHRLRGEEDRALELEAELELMYVRLGSVWQMEAQAPLMVGLGYGQTRDVLGMKRCIERFDRLLQAGYKVGPYLDVARGEYHRERGELAPSEAALRRVLSGESGESPIAEAIAYYALAETLLAKGDAADAKEWATRAIDLAENHYSATSAYRFRAIRTLALAEASLGDMAGAARRLDVAIAQASTAASPTICGPLHEARARVALLASEWSVFERHRLEVESWFKPTRNPVLIARVQQLIDAGRPQSRRSIDQRVVGADAVTIPDRHQNHGVSSALSACRGRSERAQQVLDFLIHAASGRAGYLYLAGEGSALELAAPAFGEEPPDELALAAHAAFDGSGDGDERAAETVVEGRRTRRSSAHRVIVLATAVDSQPVVIGAVVVVEGAVRLTEPSPALVSDLARALLEAGDAAPRVQG